MIDNRARRLLFIEAALVLVLVYFITLGATHFLDRWRIDKLDGLLYEYNLRHQSFIAANTFYEVIGKADCNFSKSYIMEEYDSIKELGINLATFKDRILEPSLEKHDLKKRAFLIAQTENLNKIQVHNRLCDNKIFPVFYFVDGDITGFNQQSLLLQQFALNNQDEVVIYTIDLNYYDEPAIRFLINMHNASRHNKVVFGSISNKEGGALNIGELSTELERLRDG